MVKIAMIGAGSLIFCKRLVEDIVFFDALKDAHISLMDIDEERLELTFRVLEQMKRQNDLSCKFTATKDRSAALKNADFVITMIQVGGLEPYKIDIEIPLKYSIDQCIGDTLNPGGIFRGLRHVAALKEIFQDVAEVSSRDVIVMNYSNPMAICTWAMKVAFPSIQSVGLCHGVQHTTEMLCNWLNIPMDECEIYTAGINHMAWFLQFKRNGNDLYPSIWDKVSKEGQKDDEQYRFEMMKATGYFMTESAGHLSEYLPYFRNREDLLKQFNRSGFGGERSAYYKYCCLISETFQQDMTDWVSGKTPTPFAGDLSEEYAASIINAKVTGQVIKFVGNVINNGLIQNLPDDCCVEVPIFMDKLGMHASSVGKLPDHCAALCLSNINVQRLAVKAALEGDMEAVFQACLMDPLTAAVLAPHEIRNMADEMIEAQMQWLPQFKGKSNEFPGHSIGRLKTSDTIIEKGRQMLVEWKTYLEA